WTRPGRAVSAASHLWLGVEFCSAAVLRVFDRVASVWETGISSSRLLWFGGRGPNAGLSGQKRILQQRRGAAPGGAHSFALRPRLLARPFYEIKTGWRAISRTSTT